MNAPGSTIRFVITPENGAVSLAKPSNVSVRSRLALATSNLALELSTVCGTTKSGNFFWDSLRRL